MEPARPQDKNHVIDILTAAFEDNKSVNYIVKQDKRRIGRIRHLMAYAFEMCSMFGRVYLSQDKNACALVIFPEQKKTTLKSILLDLSLLIHAVGMYNMGKTLKREKKIKAIQPCERMAYLWFIGVEPSFQSKGKGNDLMNKVIEIMSKDNRPIYLETSTAANLLWYNKFGFEIYDQLDLGYELSFLRRSRKK